MTEESVARFINWCHEKEDQTPDLLDDFEKIVCLASTVDFEVTLGGFYGFYNNSSGDKAVETIKALKQIGAEEAAEALGQSLCSFPNPENVSSREYRLNHLGDLAYRFRAAEAKYYHQDPCVRELLDLTIYETLSGARFSFTAAGLPTSSELKDTSIGALLGIPNPDASRDDTQKYPLEKWWDKVYDLPFSHFSVENLARACRQNVFPEHIVPRVLLVLRKHPLAGMLYEGELFHSLSEVPMDFWKQAPKCRQGLLQIFNQWKEVLADEFDDDTSHDFAKLKRFISSVKDTAGE